jgi:hypothetical protein
MEPDETNVTPIPFLLITIVRLPSRRSTIGDPTIFKPALSRYQSADRSISETNKTTSGLVGAAVVQGPRSALARPADTHATRITATTRSPIRRQRAGNARRMIGVQDCMRLFHARLRGRSALFRGQRVNFHWTAFSRKHRDIACLARL